MIIYSFTNLVNGKVYIGQTSGPPINRMKDHIHAARKGAVTPLYHAIRKYGEANFRFDVIASALDDAIDDLEILLIAQHKSYTNDVNSHGYNQTRGGKGWSSDVVKYMAKNRDLINYSPSAKKRTAKLIEEGRHNFQGEVGSKRASALNKKWMEDGTHPSLKDRTCPHCGKTGRGPNMYRYHFDKCPNHEKTPQGLRPF